MPQKNIYYSRINHVRYVFRNGNDINFTQHQYLTDDPNQIAELDNEVRLGHPVIYVDPNKLTIDPITLDPMHALRERIIAEYMAEQAKVIGNPQRDLGKTESPKLIPANSRSIASGALGGSGVTTFSPPANLAKALEEAKSAENSQPVVDPDISAGLAALSVFNAGGRD